MTTSFTADDLKRALDAATLARGREYAAAGRVKKITVSDDGTTIAGAVDGSRQKPYTVIISIRPGARGGCAIDGHCSCPVSFDCKHVAAVLLHRLATIAPASAPGAAPMASAGPAEATRAKPTAKDVLPPPLPKPAAPVVSAEVTGWLDRLVSAASAPPAAKVSSAKEVRGLVYVLNPSDSSHVREATYTWLRAVNVRYRRDGSIADDHRPYDPENAGKSKEQVARYLTEQDVDLLREMIWLRRSGPMHYGTYDCRLTFDALGTRVLSAALATGRVRLGTMDGPPLRPGQPVLAAPTWLRAEDGRQKLSLIPSPEAGAGIRFDDILPLAPPWYLDRARGLAGPIETSLAPSMALSITRSPWVAPSEAALVRETMRTRLGGSPTAPSPADDGPSAAAPVAPQMPLPDAPDDVETRVIAPVPRLVLLLAEARMQHAYSWYTTDARHRGTFRIPLARLAFDYGGHAVDYSEPSPCLQFTENDKLVLVPRDTKAELAAFERLKPLGLGRLSQAPFSVGVENKDDLFLYPPGKYQMIELARKFDDPVRFLTFSTEALPPLMRDGWQIAFSADYPYRIADGEATWWADVGEGSGIDWFSFEVGVEFEGQRINLVPTLARLIGDLPAAMIAAAADGVDETEWLSHCGKLRLFHTLPDGRLLPLPGERVAPILKALIELVGPRQDRLQNGKVRIHRAEAGALAAFASTAGTDVAWAVEAEHLIQLGNRLSGGVKLELVQPPRSFKASLRPYQAEGLSWLEFLRDAGFGGALADDMGLGKTVQALAFLAREKAEGRLAMPALIVCPTSVLPNWKAEAERFAPTLSVLPLYGPERAELFGQIDEHDLVLTTYPLLARDGATLLSHEFHVAILDEAQVIKNPRTAVAGIAHQINARHRLALTGTPLENNLGEVWSLFHFLAPGLLGDESEFRRTFRTPIEKHGSQEAQTFLTRRLKPFMLRRTKEEVATELPPKTEIVVPVRLEGAQRDLYETIRSLMHQKVREAIDKKGLAKSHIIFLDALLKLRQVCCDPRLLKVAAAKSVHSSAKLDRLMEMLPELVGEGRRILIFSQFTSMLALIEDELRRAKIDWVKLTGETTDRAVPVNQFQNGRVPVFLLSLKAGGTGLNLTAADTVIHYDPWWNPAVENQATDRAYRIGQTKPVFVYKLIVEEGIEQAIEQLKARKAALADALFAGNTGKALDLTEADIAALFAPLSQAANRRLAA